jgi:hypothetical protein
MSHLKTFRYQHYCNPYKYYYEYDDTNRNPRISASGVNIVFPVDDSILFNYLIYFLNHRYLAKVNIDNCYENHIRMKL